MIRNSSESPQSLIDAYLRLSKKNQDTDFKKHSRFLKIFPLYFATNAPDFYDDPEIIEIKKLLADLNIKLSIFELPTTTQECFWFMLFNFMTPINATIEMNTQRRKILSEKYCRKVKPDSRTLQNIFLRLENSGLLVKTSKDKHTSTYIVILCF